MAKEHPDDSLGTSFNSIIDSARTGISSTDSMQIKGIIAKFTNRIRRRFRESNSSNLLTMFPIWAVLISLGFTFSLLPHSGVLDCRDDFSPSFCNEEPALNVNGDLEVYLPTDDDPHSVKNLIAQVEEDWTTNVMVIYVESYNYNVTQINILDQIDSVERVINNQTNDKGADDNVIYVLSISTVIKEVNSSGGRVVKAFFSGLAEATGNQQLSDEINETIDAQSDLIGNYAIPDEQQRIDQILQEMPQNALDKLVRDVGTATEERAFRWNRAVIIIGIADDTGDKSVGDIVSETQGKIDEIADNNNWGNPDSQGKCTEDDSLCLRMTLTGPAPLTNAVTEESFKLFWKVFPQGCILVAGMLFIFHCDLLQTGRIRFVQGVKVVIISGLPTLCAVWVTLGLIGFLDYEVTMTVILVGPIVLSLGVSYGLHITNRYAESKGTPHEKMSAALNSTGRAVFLSAMTTIIGFISLTFAPMKPIQTVGWALAGGIVVVYVMTMLMVPNLTILLDLKKPSHPPPKVFVAAVNMPVKWSRITITLFLTLMLISAGYNRQNVEENIDLLKMAPNEVEAVQKMDVYSNEFDAGQPGFLLVEANIEAEPELGIGSITAEHPYANLEGIENLEAKCNDVENATAVSIVFLMKAIAVGVNISGSPINDIIDDTPLPEPIKEVAELIFDREQSGNVSFWTILDTLDAQEDDGGRQVQNFLLYVFYNSMTEEMRELFISPDYQRTLIYIDMPFMDVKATAVTAEQINNWAKAAGDSENPISVLGDTLIGVASITIEVNNLIVDSQWTSLAFALGFTVITLALVFRDIRFALLTTIPVGFTVAMQWLVMDSGGVTLSLVTVMIGSILVGVGIDFSIHIANRVKELGGSLDAIRSACASTGMSLFEATTVTAAGLTCAYGIPIEAITPFVTVIIILLIVAALSALLLLPAIYSFMVTSNLGLTGGMTAMVKNSGLTHIMPGREVDISRDANVFDQSGDAW
jgi:predicted RND superfamily exporter protein